MAIFHLNIKIGKRSAGRSAVAAAAYRAADILHDEESKLQHDFTRKNGVIFSEILLPENAPIEYADRQTLWNAAQAAERSAKGQLFREIEVGLPVEMTREQQIQAVHDYCMNFVRSGMCCDWSLHDKGDGNPHAHIMLTMRSIDARGRWENKRRDVYANDRDENGKPFFNPEKPNGKENRIPRIDKETGEQKRDKKGALVWERVSVGANDWNSLENAEQWREAWARECNQYLDLAHQIDHRSFERQGIDRVATVHEGYVARAMEKRGDVSDRCELNREIKALNEARRIAELKQRELIGEESRRHLQDVLERRTTELKQLKEQIEAKTQPKQPKKTAEELNKTQRQIEAIRRRKRAEKAKGKDTEHKKIAEELNVTTAKIEEIKARRQRKDAIAYEKNIDDMVRKEQQDAKEAFLRADKDKGKDDWQRDWFWMSEFDKDAEKNRLGEDDYSR